MSDKSKLRETMWAEMTPDCYGGATCDKIVPRWYAHADGDRDGDYEGTLKLASRTFPPGTKIVISEPLCPKCEALREPIYPTPKRGPLYSGKCECGFDWDEWTLEQFS
jgi:hypothetical protein